MSEHAQRFNAIEERINELDKKSQDKNLTQDEKNQIISDLIKCAIGLAGIALEKMDQNSSDSSIQN